MDAGMSEISIVGSTMDPHNENISCRYSLLLMPGTAGAHHGYAAFDTSAEVTLKGTVTDFHFTNPHCVIEIDVKDEKGQVQNWKAELTSANHLAPKGWTESSVQAGDELAITGYRAKNGAPRSG